MLCFFSITRMFCGMFDYTPGKTLHCGVVRVHFAYVRKSNLKQYTLHDALLVYFIKMFDVIHPKNRTRCQLFMWVQARNENWWYWFGFFAEDFRCEFNRVYHLMRLKISLIDGLSFFAAPPPPSNCFLWYECQFSERTHFANYTFAHTHTYSHGFPIIYLLIDCCCCYFYVSYFVFSIGESVRHKTKI